MQLFYIICIPSMLMLPMHAQLVELLRLEQSLQAIYHSPSTPQPPLIPDDITEHLDPTAYKTLHELIWTPRISTIQERLVEYNKNRPSDQIALSTIIKDIAPYCRKQINTLQTSSKVIISLLDNRFVCDYTKAPQSTTMLQLTGDNIYKLLINIPGDIIPMNNALLYPEIQNIAHCFLAITIGSILCTMGKDTHQQFTDAILTIIKNLDGITSKNKYYLSNVMKHAVTTDTLKQAYDMGYLYYKYTDGLMSKLYIDSPRYREKIYTAIAALIDPHNTLRQALSTYLAKHTKNITDYFVSEQNASIDKKLCMFFNNRPSLSIEEL